MGKSKSETFGVRNKNDALGGKRFKLYHFLLGVGILYLVFIYFKFPQFLEIASAVSGDDSFVGLDRPDQGKSLFGSAYKDTFHRHLEDSRNQNAHALLVSEKESLGEEFSSSPPIKPLQHRYGRITREIMRHGNRTSGLSELEKVADEAWTLGLKAWDEVENFGFKEINQTLLFEGTPESCPTSISMSGDELAKIGNLMFLPCGLAAGSSITVVGTPHKAHKEYVPQLARLRHGDPSVWVSQFNVELQGLRTVDGEDPPRILQLKPRLKGDWSQKTIIEHNTCYRMQWGKAQRCDGIPSNNDDDTVDGFRRCEMWIHNDIVDRKESKTTSWLKRFIGRAKKPEMTWPFPFVEDRLFILTLRAGVEGYHVNIGGRHVSSFPYRTGFTLEDATGLAVKGNVYVHSVYATALPVSHPSLSSHQVLEMSDKWKSHPLPKDPVHLFVGILSSSNHFSERMAVRKTWMQSAEFKSSKAVARFFVALNPRKEVNAALKMEADFFGDIVILPFMDRYDLVVLKTIAICEFGVHNLTASYIMKCDDDTFIRVNTVLKEINPITSKMPLYMGNLNLLHRPLRSGKWAVTYEEWPAEVYPAYANGPGYIISADIAQYIVSQHANQSLRLFKMEDVSMGMWVEEFNASIPVQYSHSWKFCQYGCIEDYYTAHYQSPRQMVCLWDKLVNGRAHCCNYR